MLEHHERLRASLQEFLSWQGAEVISCSNASEVLQQLEQNQADIVLTALRMRGEEGFQLLRDIRQKQMGATAPVIAILPQPSRILTEQLLAAGFSGLIEKPFDAMQLIEVIRSNLA